MSFTVVIPARYASSRLPGKPLAMIAGKPMIQHVCERAAESRASRVVVATDDARIEEACRGFGAEVVMTSPNHASGTDRLEEVARKLELDADHRVVNVQGDEPLIPPALINQVAENLELYPEAEIATLCERLHDARQVFNPNVVKVVFDARGMAHYFSRAPIPWARDFWPANAPAVDVDLPDGVGYFRHIGIYGYRASVLRQFVTWPPAPTEQVEALEQLRALYNGARIHVDIAERPPAAGVDTEEDLARIRALLEAGGRYV
ncbi:MULTISPECIES: 3-deoxy-manno-octulosonate cytidylyltransferase [Marinobacter]|jgi:3-deoxy-manno-octulosonate cytidylyltransferase (CMP-KDO synthetase)|uniref:3-deoxy-manno-octulosonate cytidylyltransferase n=1 Tax=Marinobacter vinifirmus TaxID=355591 RepID=A0A7Z1DWM7_9GAMM|nr:MULTISPECIES: 3-deoxy-manno-octulosonate cytidylyltransferase [Marinobacter]OZC37341.1 3-deoxy-manno-octulosonate cytidylyltransferase [Marinobacter vinifirmus]|tara:strand:+ start:22907 stop:23692 length:786 start_codon:yes stop_codon:yes gene_type:complete